MELSGSQGGVNALARPKGRCVEHRIEVEAQAGAIWDVISDLDGWGRWNPLYTKVRGQARAGERIAVTVAVPGLPVQQAVATIITVQPDAVLEYEIVNLGGLIRAFRYIEIRSISPDRCMVLNGEILSGAIGLILSRLLGARVQVGLQAMNKALKQCVEADLRSDSL